MIDPRLMERRKTVAEHRAKRNVARLIRALIGAAVLGSGVWVSLSPTFSVSQVRSTGVQASDAYEILVRHEVVAGTPMVLIRAGMVEEALEADPWISDARVHLAWPDEIVVRVVERVPVAWVLTDAGWTRRSIDGVALPSAPQPGEEFAWVELPEVASDEAHVSRLVLGGIEFAASLTAHGARVFPDGVGLRALVGGFEVQLGRPVYMAEKARSLEALLKEPIPPGSTLILVAPTHPAIRPPPNDHKAGATAGDSVGDDAPGGGDGQP